MTQVQPLVSGAERLSVKALVEPVEGFIRGAEQALGSPATYLQALSYLESLKRHRLDAIAEGRSATVDTVRTYF